LHAAVKKLRSGLQHLEASKADCSALDARFEILQKVAEDNKRSMAASMAEQRSAGTGMMQKVCHYLYCIMQPSMGDAWLLSTRVGPAWVAAVDVRHHLTSKLWAVISNQKNVPSQKGYGIHEHQDLKAKSVHDAVHSEGCTTFRACCCLVMAFTNSVSSY
jgi:uncharacterized membrane-anchored protein